MGWVMRCIQIVIFILNEMHECLSSTLLKSELGLRDIDSSAKISQTKFEIA